MSLYNMLFGVNGHAPALLAILGVTADQIPRFRDVYIKDDCIVIHTRTGGGNRDMYENEASARANYPEYFKGSEDDPKGPWNDDLRKISGYVRDEDDDYDSTYADFYFLFPEGFATELKALSANSPDVTPSEKWQAMLAALKSA